MKFSFLSLFPHLISFYFCDSILGRAVKNGLIEVEFIDFRKFSNNKHKKVDSPQISGGAGLVIEPIVLENAINNIANKDSHIIYLSPVARQFNQFDAKRIAKNYNHIIFVCGRYEGVDERFIEMFVDEIFCVGDFIVTGGEVPSLMLCDCISRQIDGVLGNVGSLDGESFENNLLESPLFTKIPHNNLMDKKVCNLSFISEFSKGNHSKIALLKNQLSSCKTKYFRPDIYNSNKR